MIYLCVTMTGSVVDTHQNGAGAVLGVMGAQGDLALHHGVAQGDAPARQKVV